MIVFSNVTKEFDGRTVLDNVAFTIQPGEFVCVTGPSGAGKSTIIHMLIRAEVPTTGTIEVDGADITKLPASLLQVYRRRTGIVFQDYKLFADRTVFENIAFALEACGASDDEIQQRVTDIVERLGLSVRRDAFPEELSGGEKTRVALARALINGPTILIADEPTGNIDPDQSVAILRLLREIHAQGTTVILATHDKTIVDALGVRVLRLENGKLVRDSVGGYSAAKEMRLVEPAPHTDVAAAVEQKRTDDALPKPGRHTPKETNRGSQNSARRALSGASADTKKAEPEEPTSGHVKPIEIHD